MKNLIAEKDKLRGNIASLKKQFSEEILLAKSRDVISVLEILGVFQEAKNIFIYNNLSGEVGTSELMKHWEVDKHFYLPVSLKDEIVFREYTSSTVMKRSAFGVDEPEGADFKDYSKVDLIIVPGVAFDRRMNRMGYGKGYYDKYLPNIKAPKIGICFDFQLFDSIPTNDRDIKMDFIVSENDLIWK